MQERCMSIVKLSVFRNRVLRRIFGPNRDEMTTASVV
jgi:hypothetical protein